MTHAKWAHGTCLFFLVVVDRNWECEKKETKSPVNQRKDCLIYFVLLFIPTQTKIQTLTYWQLSSEFGHSSKQNAKEKLPSSRKRKKRKDKYSTSLPPAFCMPNNSKRNNLKKKKRRKSLFFFFFFGSTRLSYTSPAWVMTSHGAPSKQRPKPIFLCFLLVFFFSSSS